MWQTCDIQYCHIFLATFKKGGVWWQKIFDWETSIYFWPIFALLETSLNTLSYSALLEQWTRQNRTLRSQFIQEDSGLQSMLFWSQTKQFWLLKEGAAGSEQAWACFSISSSGAGMPLEIMHGSLMKSSPPAFPLVPSRPSSQARPCKGL